MKLLTALVILRLGAFVVGACAYSAASYFGWSHAGWLLVPTVIAGLMCCSLSVGDNDSATTEHSSTDGKGAA